MSHVHLGELALARALVTGAALESDCAECRAVLDEARATAATFARAVQPRTLPAIEARLDRRRFAWVGLALAAAAVVALWFAVRAPTADRPVIAAKGGPALHLIGTHALGSDARGFAVDPGDRLAPGDAIRFVLDSTGGRYLLVVSVDGAGQTSVYFPYGGDRSAPIDDSSTHLVLDGSIVLDAAPGPERIWALVSDRPIALAELRAQLAAIAAGGAPALRADTELLVPDAHQTSAWFEKEITP